MPQILVQVKNRQKAKMLCELLTALDFVNVVEAVKEQKEHNPVSSDENIDFFSFAGLWEKRDVNLSSIRQKAWQR